MSLKLQNKNNYDKISKSKGRLLVISSRVPAVNDKS